MALMLSRYIWEYRLKTKIPSHYNFQTELCSLPLKVEPEECGEEEDDPEGGRHDEGRPEDADLRLGEELRRVAVPRLEHPLGVALLVDVVPPAEAHLKEKESYLKGRMQK